jgi:hypothetical protein
MMDEFSAPIATIKFNDEEISSNLKVFVVWHRVYEDVLSVHFTEQGAQEYIEASADADTEKYGPNAIDRFEYDEFEVKI